MRSLYESSPSPAAEQASGLIALAEVERNHILQVLAACDGKRTLAAKILGIDRKTLYRKLRGYGIEPTAGGATPTGSRGGLPHPRGNLSL